MLTHSTFFVVSECDESVTFNCNTASSAKASPPAAWTQILASRSSSKGLRSIRSGPNPCALRSPGCNPHLGGKAGQFSALVSSDYDQARKDWAHSLLQRPRVIQRRHPLENATGLAFFSLQLHQGPAEEQKRHFLVAARSQSVLIA